MQYIQRVLGKHALIVERENDVLHETLRYLRASTPDQHVRYVWIHILALCWFRFYGHTGLQWFVLACYRFLVPQSASLVASALMLALVTFGNWPLSDKDKQLILSLKQLQCLNMYVVALASL